MIRVRWLLPMPLAATLAGCGFFEPSESQMPSPRPHPVTDFDTLYAESCAGCHGGHGEGGASVALSDPVYLAIAGDDVIRKATADGIRGTAMPAFAESAGGSLSAQQIDALVQGIRKWAKPGELAGIALPPYHANVAGDAQRGALVFEKYCGSCHGIDGKGAKKAGSVVDPSYLALVSGQGLRTIVIVGRPELGAPDWRGDLAGHPMTAQDISDVVAWLETQARETQKETDHD